MKTSEIHQGNTKFLHTIKTVDWLVNNTYVSVFDPVKFDGYQREINDSHCEKIVKYLKNNFYLPTPIICSCDEKYSDDINLRIVDGQHRVRAFKNLMEKDNDRYQQIKSNQISVIIMEQVDIEKEIDTFITINKTSKRVDTSLAYVLKNKLNIEKNSGELTISKLDYISVELAVLMNETNSIWKNKISFTGSPRQNSLEVISLNAFVKATRQLIGQLDKQGIIELKWENKNEINNCIKTVENIINNLWVAVREKWKNLFEYESSNVKIIQGPIGYSSITRFIANEIKNLETEQLQKIDSINMMDKMINKWINSIDLFEEVWYQGNKFSKLTSESGYNIIASELKNSMK